MTISFDGLGPIIASASYVIDVHLSYGQSWRSNVFDSFASPYPMNQNAVQAGLYRNVINQSVQLPTSAGITYSNWAVNNTMIGITKHLPTDVFTIGTCAVIAQKLLAVRDGATTVQQTLEMCFAFPGSTWLSGGTGGLSPGSTFTASITSDLMTVTGSPVGTIVPGQLVTGAGIPASGASSGYIITSAGTGTGGAGTYNTALAQLFVSQQMTVGTAVVVADMFTGAIPGNVLKVSSVVSGSIGVGNSLQAPPALAGSKISADLGGGSYQVTVGTAVTVGSEAMQSFGGPWRNLGLVTTQLQSALPFGPVSKLSYSSMGYTQASSADNTEAGKVADLNAMLIDVDALNLPGAGTTGMNYYLGTPSAVSNSQNLGVSVLGTYDFCRTNAPGQGGTWSGRCFYTAPSYAWPFNGADNIHTGDYGTLRWGEQEGYVRRLVQDLGIQWTPLWRPLTGGAIVISGQTITIPMDRPAGPDFVGKSMVFQSDPLDGIQVWPNFGWNVLRTAAFLTLGVAIDGMNIVLTVTEPLHTGDALEVSYAYHGPGGPNPGPNSGVGGNLVMHGPPSVLISGNTIDSWAAPFFENVVVP